MHHKISPEQLAKAYKTACMAELQALKPGNVHVFRDGHGMTIHDFIKSADVTAELLAQPDLSLGERIFYAVEATKQAVGQNTNLGVILLCAPIMATVLCADDKHTLAQSLERMLVELSVGDAQWVAKSIVLANPGGLGLVALHDVCEEPQVTLFEVMRTAQGYDRIAWQYANTYRDVMGFGVACYAKAMAKWQNPAWATTALYLGFLTRNPDTHVMRKHGEALAIALMAEAQEYADRYWVTDNIKLVQKDLLGWDASLKLRDINPGTSADLTVATLLATYLQAYLDEY